MTALESLGPQGFQDVAAALVVAQFGIGVTVMGPGRDGGRDLAYRGTLSWGAEPFGSDDVWAGYTVFQVKHKSEISSTRKDNLLWLKEKVRQELDDWSRPERDRGEVPDFLCIVTNVPMTPAPRGGVDQMATFLDEYVAALAAKCNDAHGTLSVSRTVIEVRADDGNNSEIEEFLSRLPADLVVEVHSDTEYHTDVEALGRPPKDLEIAKLRARLQRISKIKQIRYVPRAQLDALLLIHKAVRSGVPGLMTPADVLENLPILTDRVSAEELEPALRSHARTTLKAESQIYFDEAGSGQARPFPLHDVVIDLPISRNEIGQTVRDHAAKFVVERAERVLKPSLLVGGTKRHIVISGPPGNGKSTLSRFIVQVFRSAFIDPGQALSEEHRRVIAGTEGALGRLEISRPHHRRWPIRLDLAEFARNGGGFAEGTILKWIAEKVSKQSDVGDVSAATLLSWLNSWPWLVVLDGLDEVSQPSTRKALIEQITSFVENADADDCDLLVVLTTRPLGYTEDISPQLFEQVELDSLTLDQAMAYGSRATQVRLGDDTERIGTIVSRLERIKADPNARDLLKTPLQVLIMTIILESGGTVYPDRFSFFNGYYETIVRREQGKPNGGLVRLLNSHAALIAELHVRVGFELHVRSEEHGGEAFFSARDLRDLAWLIMEDAGFLPAGSDAGLLTQLVDAATQRLVLLAPRQDKGLGFDVRSLQELMAAKYISAGPFDRVLERLQIAAPSPHWRNVWVFVAGSIYAGPHANERAALATLLSELDQSAPTRLGAVLPVAPRIALELMDDGMARAYPVWRTRFAEIAGGLLFLPVDPDLVSCVRSLTTFAKDGDDQFDLIKRLLVRGLNGTPISHSTTNGALMLIEAEAHATRNMNRLMELRLLRVSYRPDVTRVDAEEGWQMFERTLDSGLDANRLREELGLAVDQLRYVDAGGALDRGAIDNLLILLEDQSMAELMQDALRHLSGTHSTLLSVLRDQVLAEVARNPVGQSLRSGGQVAL